MVLSGTAGSRGAVWMSSRARFCCAARDLGAPIRAGARKARILFRNCTQTAWGAKLLALSSFSYDSERMTKPVTRPEYLREKSQIMSASEIDRTLVRLAHEIVEKNNGVQDLGLVGIQRRGVPLAQRLAKILGRIEKTNVPVGTLDITLYRDDLSTVGHHPEYRKGEMEFDIQNKNIILVDDVLYTGRTTRAALGALFDHGRPRRIQLCALIDRGHRELPIEAAFVGRKIETTQDEIVEVKLQETDSMEKVLLVERNSPGQ